jgi:signal peptidase II
MRYTLATAGAVVALDAFSKQQVMSRMALGETLPIIEGLLYFTYIQNPGAAYGLFSGGRWFLIGIALVVVLATLIYARQVERLGEKILLGVFIGGALGNLIDRVRWGMVTDFIQVAPLPIFNVFNLADVAVVTSSVILVLLMILESSKVPGTKYQT